MRISSTELRRLTGMSVRQLNYWCKVGLIHPIGETHPGSGYNRQFDSDIVDPVKMMVRMSKAFDYQIGTNVLKQVYHNYDKGKVVLDDGIVLSWGL